MVYQFEDLRLAASGVVATGGKQLVRFVALILDPDVPRPEQIGSHGLVEFEAFPGYQFNVYEFPKGVLSEGKWTFILQSVGANQMYAAGSVEPGESLIRTRREKRRLAYAVMYPRGLM